MALLLLTAATASHASVGWFVVLGSYVDRDISVKELALADEFAQTQGLASASNQDAAPGSPGRVDESLVIMVRNIGGQDYYRLVFGPFVDASAARASLSRWLSYEQEAWLAQMNMPETRLSPDVSENSTPAPATTQKDG